MTNPQVSIVLPTYNRANYLPQAIQSVIAQGYQNWELLVWNDGSSDDTEAVVKTFPDERIRYFFESNHGKCYALNRAIEKSSGNWIAIIDDDDVWHPSKLYEQMKTLSSDSNIGVLFSNFNNTNQTTGENGIGFEQNKKGLQLLRVENRQDDVFWIKDNFPQGILTANFILPSSTIINRHIFSAVGNFNEALRNSEDLELWWRIYLHEENFAFSNKILVNRLKPTGSLSSPSVATYMNHLFALNFCYQETEKKQRMELLPLFKPAYRSAWDGLIRQHALSGERKKAVRAFLSSARYGINWRSTYLLLGALAGPQLSNKIRK